MNLLIKRFNKEIALPEYKTAGAVAFDLSARERVEIKPKGIEKVPLNVAIQVPEGHWIMLVARSSLHKKGVTPINGVGIMDADYCGDEDEYMTPLYNFTHEPVVIEAGERIMQAVVIPLTRLAIQEVDQMANASRGGFGSTNL